MLRKRTTPINNQKGLTLTELVVVMAIMTMLTLMVAQVTINTIKAMMQGTAQNISQSSADMVMNKIAEDIRQAGSESDYRHIHNGSSGISINFTRFQKNMDAMSPSSTDLNFDTGCYTFISPTADGNPYSSNYRPGYIMGGSGSGDPTTPGCSNMYRLTDASVDIRSFTIEYCRPTEDAGGNIGAYDCSTANINNANLTAYIAWKSGDGNVDISDSAACVWMVRLKTVYARRYETKSQNINPSYYNDAVSKYETTVMLRNPFIMSLVSNKDKDKFVDCCDEDFGAGSNIAWCPKRNR